MLPVATWDGRRREGENVEEREDSRYRTRTPHRAHQHLRVGRLMTRLSSKKSVSNNQGTRAMRDRSTRPVDRQQYR